MKSSTVYLVLGAAAVAGTVWYLKNKSTNVPEEKAPAIMKAIMFPETKSQVQINNLPAALLQPTIGNTGITPPAILEDVSEPLKIAQAVQKPKAPVLDQQLLRARAATDLRKLELSSSKKNLSGIYQYLFN